ncbi:hypothetical protein BATDEDRAFT_92904 [Batrachochytrium dendrobatidis JAM81]|uniref:Uncharacterized protein n=1 Tax=Batrachochytrium dendrobatidis (strain JAM81 / FGSC 10211) TaxID=684364 RepID=F4PEU4_BATDJ|nr:uncharacterized protein BATDEDRAFT_92904 [Batrachochytrium dendrobatidis JAM81]EGF76238.1 hypothetical protein BATDEDRAFT_92904 [Batrachochytrium dendrobatidis JAM81]|eukprot:XP_006683128.1 hypothetical protein BATDEDRAFT_92904 [Batrachochytrium dendrobatidis JAM81]
MPRQLQRPFSCHPLLQTFRLPIDYSLIGLGCLIVALWRRISVTIVGNCRSLELVDSPLHSGLYYHNYGMRAFCLDRRFFVHRVDVPALYDNKYPSHGLLQNSHPD